MICLTSKSVLKGWAMFWKGSGPFLLFISFSPALINIGNSGFKISFSFFSSVISPLFSMITGVLNKDT